MDFITKLPPSIRYKFIYNSILVIVDRYTKIAKYFVYLETIILAALLVLFIDKIVTRYSCPRSVVSDYGPIFTSKY